MPRFRTRETQGNYDPCAPIGLPITTGVLLAAGYFIVVAIIWIIIAYIVYYTFTRDPNHKDHPYQRWRYSYFKEIQITVYIQATLGVAFLIFAAILLVGVVIKVVIMVIIALGGLVIVHVAGLLVFASQSKLLCTWQMSCRTPPHSLAHPNTACGSQPEDDLIAAGKNVCYNWIYVRYYIQYILVLFVSWYPFWVGYAYCVEALKPKLGVRAIAPENMDQEMYGRAYRDGVQGEVGEDVAVYEDEAGWDMMEGGADDKRRRKSRGRDDDLRIAEYDEVEAGGAGGGRQRRKSRRKSKRFGFFGRKKSKARVGATSSRTSLRDEGEEGGGKRRTSKVVRRTITKTITKHRPGEEDDVQVVKYTYNPSEGDKGLERRMSRQFENE